MNEKPKTLKELTECPGGICEPCSYDIKKESIKWIKLIENIDLPKNIPKNIRLYGKTMTIDFIQHFFNISNKEIEK